MKGRMLSYMRQQGMPLPGSRLIVALSGGRDSVVLLHLLIELGYRVEAAHVNFGLRGTESDEDERFVQELTTSLKIPLHLNRVDTLAFAKEQKLSIQEAARKLRYDWFDELVQETGAAVAVAHHAGDSLETVLINLLRGTGVRGLAGIRPVNGPIIRPLLFASDQEIEHYAMQKGLKWRNDSSNAKDDYLRNRIRHHLLPLMRSMVSDGHGGLDASATLLSAQAGLYAELTEKIRGDMLSEIQNGVYHLSRNALESVLHRDALIYELLAPFGFNQSQVMQLNKALSLKPGKVFRSAAYEAYVASNYIEISPIDHGLIPEQQVFPVIPDNCPLSFEVLEWKAGMQFSTNPAEAWLDLDTLKLPLMLRHPRNGDRFVPLGMQRTQLLSDFFTNNRMSRRERAQTLLLIDAAGNIVWICGKRIAHPFRITSNTKNVLRVRIKNLAYNQMNVH